MIGLFTRTLESGGFSSGNFVAVRVLGTAALLSVFFLFRDRSVFRIKPRYLLYFVGTGIVSILFFTWCYFSAMQYLSISVAVILLYTSPVFVVVLSALIFREPITRRKAAALLLTVIGCALVSGIFGGGASVTVKGFLLGLGSGFFYALYSIFGRFALRHCSSYTVTIYTFLVASAGALFLLRPAELAANFARPGMISAAALMIVVSTVAPYLLYTAGLAKVETGRASILACAEPVMATLLSIFALGEPFTLTAAAGVVCVLGAVWLLSR
jgi:drug/metabolite transporter (DMT)-like permease